jgi:hypothetical protein
MFISGDNSHLTNRFCKVELSSTQNFKNHQNCNLSEEQYEKHVNKCS